MTLTLPSVEFFSGLLTNGTDGGVQLFLRTFTIDLCSWSGIVTAPYRPDSDLFEACLISILDILFVEMAVGCSKSCGPSGLVHHSVAAPSFSTILAIEPIIWTFANVRV